MTTAIQVLHPKLTLIKGHTYRFKELKKPLNILYSIMNHVSDPATLRSYLFHTNPSRHYVYEKYLHKNHVE